MTKWATLDQERLARTLFVTLACAFVIVLSKSLSMPETALSAYLIFFIARPEATETAIASLGLCIVALVVAGATIILIMATAGAPPLRIAAMFAVTFIAMYFTRASPLGLIAAPLAMVVFEVLSILDFLAYPDLLLRGIFWLLAVIMLPMGVLFLASLLFQSDARTLLTKALQNRLALIQRAMIERSDASFLACRKCLLVGDGDTLSGWRKMAQITGRMDSKGVASATAIQDATDALLVRCAVGDPPANTPANRAALALNRDTPPDDFTLARLTSPPSTSPEDKSKPEKPSDSMQFAIKSTLAVGICYAIFVILGWHAIHTITITVFLICVGSTGETFHKAGLRIGGCLVGAAIATVFLLVIVPNLTGAGGLAALTALMLFPAAWIATGSERLSYAGMQVVMVFLLAVVNTAGPDVDLGLAWGRIFGIILANLVVAGVFLCLWPTSISDEVQTHLDEARSGLDQQKPPGQPAVALAKAREALEVLRFEPGSEKLRQTLSSMADDVETALLSTTKVGRPSISAKDVT